jgi:centromeric protein E
VGLIFLSWKVASPCPNLILFSQEKEHQCLKMKAVDEAQEKICEMERLKEQFEAQKSTLENIEKENVKLTQKLHENLEEMKSVTKERDDLRNMEKTLKEEREQLEENLKDTITRVSYISST